MQSSAAIDGGVQSGWPRRWRRLATALACRESTASDFGACRSGSGQALQQHTCRDMRKQETPSEMAAVASLLARLHRLLARLSPDRRRHMLHQRFTQEQRLGLEKWLLDRRWEKSSDKGSESLAHIAAVTGCELALRPSGSISVETQCLATAASMHAALSSSLDSTPSPRSQVATSSRGIVTHQRHGSTLYSAVVLVERLEIRTRLVPDAHIAVGFRDLLLDVKERLCRGLRENMPDVFADSFPSEWTLVDGRVTGMSISRLPLSLLRELVTKAVMDASQPFFCDPVRDVGIYFRVSTPARPWIGTTLWGPVFRFGASFASGIRGWQLMQTARGNAVLASEAEAAEVWQKVRQAHISIWTESGRDACEIASQVDALESRKTLNREALLRRRESRLAAAMVALSMRMQQREKRDAARAAAKSARLAAETQRIEMQIERVLSLWSGRIHVQSRAFAREHSSAKRARIVGPEPQFGCSSPTR
eukprot:TRINITY_DN12665_c0_g2_i1.p1 TRINITY_DN12665_c0_g2~~TRINITY_DN12665_c0_g2_i1.p1  ORF type:complete len:479 (-),score=59.76 TRINITY_DN12665_c0_g2_i1:71-1507(-)